MSLHFHFIYLIPADVPFSDPFLELIGPFSGLFEYPILTPLFFLL